MTITKNSGRQEVVSAVLEFDYSGPNVTAVAAAAVDLPVGAIVQGGDLTVTTAWNTGTTATIKLGDSADDDRYTASAIDLKTAARTALTITGFKHGSTNNLLNLLPALAGTAATAGAARLTVNYVVVGRAAFSQG